MTSHATLPYPFAMRLMMPIRSATSIANAARQNVTVERMTAAGRAATAAGGNCTGLL